MATSRAASRPMSAAPAPAAQHRRDTEHRLTHDKGGLGGQCPGGRCVAPGAAVLRLGQRGAAAVDRHHQRPQPAEPPPGRVAGAWGCSSSEEVPLNWNKWVRQIHRWAGALVIAFTVTVAVSFVALGQEDPALWVLYLPLPPLALQLLTGLYL